MSEHSDPQPALESVMALAVQTKLTCSVAGTQLGAHMIYDAVGGAFEGPRLSGKVHASGGDWVTRTATGSRMNVRLLLETHDGVAILLQYSGRAFQADGKVRLEVAGNFDAPQGPYGWLNDVQAFGQGVVADDWVRYQLYRFK